MAGTIKYHYALDETGTLISVEDVCPEDRNKHRYTCLGCGAEMILKAGKVKARHFAHKINTEHCGVETYLHKLAKRIVKRKFESGENLKLSISRLYDARMQALVLSSLNLCVKTMSANLLICESSTIFVRRRKALTGMWRTSCCRIQQGNTLNQC